MHTDQYLIHAENICTDSLTDVLGVFSVLWLKDELGLLFIYQGSCLSGVPYQLVSITKVNCSYRNYIRILRMIQFNVRNSISGIYRESNESNAT